MHLHKMENKSVQSVFGKQPSSQVKSPFIFHKMSWNLKWDIHQPPYLIREGFLGILDFWICFANKFHEHPSVMIKRGTYV